MVRFAEMRKRGMPTKRTAEECAEMLRAGQERHRLILLRRGYVDARIRLLCQAKDKQNATV